MINSERCINRSCGKFVNSALPGHQKLFNSSFKCMSNTVEHTMYASVYIYIVRSVWFRFVIYKNAVLFFLYFGAVSGGFCYQYAMMRKLPNSLYLGHARTGWVNFFKTFWEEIKFLMLNSFKEYLRKQSLTEQQKTGIITCSPKQGKDRRHMKNWRPITLLNSTYNIFSGILANRIKMTLDSIIHNDQK